MKLQHSYHVSIQASRPRNGRRAAERGLSFGAALLGIVCATGVLAVLALLFHAG